MKIRQGFVSNSSSSSYVVMMKKEHFEGAVETLHPYSQACIKALGYSKGMFLAEEIVSLGTLSVQGCGPFEYLDVEYDGEFENEDEQGELKYECIYNLVTAARKIYGDEAVFTSSLDG